LARQQAASCNSVKHPPAKTVPLCTGEPIEKSEEKHLKSHIVKLLISLALIAASLFSYSFAREAQSTMQFVRPITSKHDLSVPEPEGTRPFAEINVVSAASLRASPLAEDSQATVFGWNLAPESQFRAAGSRPTTLAGTTVTVEDSAGVARQAPLLFVSPEQLDFTIPSATRTGTAKVTVTTNSGETSTASIQIVPVAPGIFTLDGTGEGIATATAVRIAPNGARADVLVFQCVDDGSCGAVPVDVSRGNVVVSFFGTGLRRRSSLKNASCTIGGLDAPVLFAGVQHDSLGPDRLDVQLPKGLSGRGDVMVVFTIDGWSTNPVTIRVE
jgi:uncharacterized protein (TIGR03437 family)